MSLSQLPNTITLFRFVLVPPILYSILQGHFSLALVLFVLAGGSDGLDGYLARRFGWRSRLGAVLDPLADKTLMMSTVLVLGLRELLPWWLVGLMIGRDLVIMVGALSYQRVTRDLKMVPSMISKLNTVMQILLVLVVLLHVGWIGLPAWVIASLIALVSLTTLASGVDYVVVWGRMAKEARKHGAQ